MTTHKNTHEQQYRHAPLNGLAIGTIVGAVWALVILGFLITPPLAKQDIKSFPPQFIMSFVFPVTGWLAGLWEQAAVDCNDSTKQKHRVKATIATIFALNGVLMASIERFLSTLRFISGEETIIYYLILLSVFSLGGWTLGATRITLRENDNHFLAKIIIATLIALYASLAVSFYVFNIIEVCFFFGT